MDIVWKYQKTAVKRFKQLTQNGDEAGGDDKRIIFLGNTWVGKSTLLNAVIGSVEFFSGSHFIQPEDTKVAHYKQKNNTFTDTPGLDDSLDFDTNAELIANALNEGEKKLKIIFVIAVPYGRIQVADVGTMNTILTALEQAGLDPTDRYGVVINQVTPTFKNKVLNNDRVQKGISAALFSRYYTKKIYFVDKCASLDCEENALLPSRYIGPLRDFVASIAAVSIPNQVVVDGNIMKEERKNAANAIMNFNDIEDDLVKLFLLRARKKLK